MFLYIPMAVRALPVGQPSENTHFSGFSYNMKNLGDESQDTEAPLFSESNREPGIYLHWSLPPCFAAGTQDQDTGEVRYRLAPNRFSVTRLWTDTDGHLQSKTFLLESDVLYASRNAAENKDSPSVAWTDDPDQPYRFLGRSFDAANPPSDYPNLDGPFIRLTAVSDTCPFFAAYALGCQNVFGFLDNPAKDNLSHVTLTYAVCGWYEEHGEPEPCSLIKSLEELEETLGLTLTGDQLPGHALCHGTVTGLQWVNEDYSYPTGTPDDPASGEISVLPRLGIGNTSAEAMAALATASLDVSDDGIEHLLYHHLAGQARELDRYYGAVKAEAQTKRSHFLTAASFSLYGLQAAVSQKREKTQSDDTSFIDQLRGLRERQRALQLNYGRYLQKERQVYENWYQHYYSEDPYYRDLYVKEMQDALTDANALAKAIRDAQAEVIRLETQLADQSPYPLEQENQECFYTPTDPVLVIEQLAPGKESGNAASGEALLPCRTYDKRVTALSLDSIELIHAKQPNLALTESDLNLHLALPKDMAEDLRKGILACVTESVLMAEAFSEFLALLACQKAGISPDASQLQWIAVQIASLQAGRSGFQGTLPDSCAFSSYQPSWSPLIIEWSAIFYPDVDLLCEKPTLKNWTLEGNDYTFSGDDKILSPQNAHYVSGRLLVSDTASRSLTNLLESLCAPLTLRENARQLQYLSQALDGFHSQLLMQDSAVVTDFYSKDSSEELLIEQLKQLSSFALTGAPLFDQLFAPIRAGFFQLDKIRLIDAMGYFQDITYPDVYAGEGLRAPGYNNPTTYVMLPPRILQPLLLSAFLADASRPDPVESFPFPESSPVCGYLVANYLDHSILVYASQGVHVCNIFLTQTGKGIQLQNAPMLDREPVPPAGLDPQLTAFLQGLLDKGPGALADLLALMDQMQLFIRTGSHAHYTTDYFGRPIALLRMQLQLMLYGDPEPYRHYLDGGEEDPSSRTDITAFPLPVQVGQQENPLDGVYGFFEDGDYQSFHSFPELYPRDHNFDSDYICLSHTVSLSLKKESPPKVLTLLMDPYGEINLITGMLPVKTLHLPQNLAEQGLDAICLSYFSAPLLCDGGLGGIPIPHTDSVDYYWAEAAKNNEKNLRPLTPPDTAASFSKGRLSLREGYIVLMTKEKNENC